MRSLLFAPANRQELVAKFPRCAADLFVIDLEDGTPEAERNDARRALPSMVSALRGTGFNHPLFIRINQPRSAHFDADLEAVAVIPIDGVMVPKLETASDLLGVSATLERGERTRPDVPRGVLGLIETAADVANAESLARCDGRLWALAFGAEDFITDIGGRRTPDGLEILYARSRVVLAAKAADIGALDQVVVDVRDDAQFRRDAAMGRQLGYDGKMCLLPRQVDLANEAFSPSEEEITRSRRLIHAFEQARREGRGAFEFEGSMVDEPLIRRARAVLDLGARHG